MDELTKSELEYCTKIAGRIKQLRELLADDLCDPPNACNWFDFLAKMKSIQGNVGNDLGFIATLLAKEYLSDLFPDLDFDCAAKPQGANGLDIDFRTADERRIIAEIKNTVPHKDNDFGGAQKREFRKDFFKLNNADAYRKFFFVTNKQAFGLLRDKYKKEIPEVEIVVLNCPAKI